MFKKIFAKIKGFNFFKKEKPKEIWICHLCYLFRFDLSKPCMGCEELEHIQKMNDKLYNDCIKQLSDIKDLDKYRYC